MLQQPLGPPQNQPFPQQLQQFPQPGQIPQPFQQQLIPQQQRQQQQILIPQQQLLPQQQLFPQQLIPQQQQPVFQQPQFLQGLQPQPQPQFVQQLQPLSPPGILQQGGGLFLQPRTQIIPIPQPQAMSALPQQRFVLPQPQVVQLQQQPLVFSPEASPVRAGLVPIGRPGQLQARTALSATNQGGLGVPTDFQAPQGSLMSNEDCDLLGLPPVCDPARPLVQQGIGRARRPVVRSRRGCRVLVRASPRIPALERLVFTSIAMRESRVGPPHGSPSAFAPAPIPNTRSSRAIG